MSSSSDAGDARRFFLSRSHKAIRPDHVHVVTPTGGPDFGWGLDVAFVAPQHRWRAEYLPEGERLVRLVREDVGDGHHYWISAPGLIGVRPHAMHGRFRMVRHETLLAVATTIAEQMSRTIPGTDAVVEVPEGFAIDIVPLQLVYGTREAHAEAVRRQATSPSPKANGSEVPRPRLWACGDSFALLAGADWLSGRPGELLRAGLRMAEGRSTLPDASPSNEPPSVILALDYGALGDVLANRTCTELMALAATGPRVGVHPVLTDPFDNRPAIEGQTLIELVETLFDLFDLRPGERWEVQLAPDVADVAREVILARRDTWGAAGSKQAIALLRTCIEPTEG